MPEKRVLYYSRTDSVDAVEAAPAVTRSRPDVLLSCSTTGAAKAVLFTKAASAPAAVGAAVLLPPCHGALRACKEYGFSEAGCHIQLHSRWPVCLCCLHGHCCQKAASNHHAVKSMGQNTYKYTTPSRSLLRKQEVSTEG